jgi:hypothetical protein
VKSDDAIIDKIEEFMENSAADSSLKTPSKTNWGLWIRLLAGASLVLFLVFVIFSLVTNLNAGGKFDASSIPALIGIIYPIVFSSILLARGAHTRRGLAFGLNVAGILIWGVVLYVLFFIFLLVGGIVQGASCGTSSSSISSALTSSSSSNSQCTNEISQALNGFGILIPIFLLSAIAHEVFLGLSAFGRKKLPILLYIFSGLEIIASLVLGIFIVLKMNANQGYYLLPFIGTDLLLVAIDFVVLYGDNEKVSPHPEDTLSHQ